MSIGFECPNCLAARTDVKDSRPRLGGGVRRRRVCPACNLKFTTFETARPDAGADMLPATAKQIIELSELMTKLGPTDRHLLMVTARRLSEPRAADAVLPTRRFAA